MINQLATNEITERIVGAAIDVHRALGPGLLESAYEACLCYELMGRGLHVERQKAIRLRYKSLELDCGYRVDLLVEGRVVVELKTVARIEPIRMAQVLSYLRLSGCHVGLLINFNVKRLLDGLRRLVDGPADQLSDSPVRRSLPSVSGGS